MATFNGISFSLKRPDPPKSKKAARDAEDLRELNNIFETRFRKAGLPEEPYVMNIDDRFDSISDRSRYGSHNHANVRHTPFAPEEAYLQYQSLYYRDFYAMDDCILRLHNPQDEVFLGRMGVRPTTAQSTSEAEALKPLPKERKKISLKDYQARSKAGTQVSAPVVPHAGSADLRKAALKHAFADKDEPAAEPAPKLSTIEVKTTPTPHIKVDAVESKSSAMVQPENEKTPDTSMASTSNFSAGTKRNHEDFSSDAHMKSDISSPPPSKKPRSTASPAPSAELPTSATKDGKTGAVVHEIAIAEYASTVAKTRLATEQSVALETSEHHTSGPLLPHFPNPTGKKRKRGPDRSPPRFTPDGRDATPSSPDTVGPRNVSSTESSRSSAHSNRSVLWSSDSDRSQTVPPKPKPTQAGVARPLKAPASVLPKPQTAASTAPLKPKIGTGIAKKITKAKKNVSTGSADFLQSLSPTPMLGAARPPVASSAPRTKPTAVDPRQIAFDAAKKADKLVIKFKYSRKFGQRVQKLFGPPAPAFAARLEPTEEDTTRLQRLASHLRREIGKQRAFGLDGLVDVLVKAAAGIEAHLKN